MSKIESPLRSPENQQKVLRHIMAMCKELGIDPRSREGMLFQMQYMPGLMAGIAVSSGQSLEDIHDFFIPRHWAICLIMAQPLVILLDNEKKSGKVGADVSVDTPVKQKSEASETQEPSAS